MQSSYTCILFNRKCVFLHACACKNAVIYTVDRHNVLNHTCAHHVHICTTCAHLHNMCTSAQHVHICTTCAHLHNICTKCAQHVYMCSSIELYLALPVVAVPAV
eukprot:GHVS01103347.1.p1 GENE.GHVS01103347.1~~GHVS01103347.1.p1  ORF type:complete len:104 (-),score=6.37 GHVS01103347.1:200-511(-)